MLNRSFLLCIIFCFILPIHTLAHSALKDSTPADGEVVESPVELIELRFDTKIEPISTLEIQSNEGTIVELSRVEVTNDTLIGYLDNPLTSGTYLVLWKIVGLDGHLVEGQFSFESLYEPPANLDTTEEDANTGDDTVEETELNTDQQEGEAAEDSDLKTDEVGTAPAYTEQDSPFYSILFTVFGVIALALIYRLWVKGRTS